MMRRYIKPYLPLALSILLATVPFGRLAWVLSTTGADTISNDYLYFVRLIEQVLSGSYDWSNYFKDSLFNSVHSYAFLFLFRLGLAQITHLSVSSEIYVGLALALAKVLLLFRLFYRSDQPRYRWAWLILPAQTALVFSYSQISAYSYGETALQMGFVQLFILTGIWLLVAHSHRAFTPWGMAAAGVLASFSGGAGIMAWPVFLLAILLTSPSCRRKYLAWVTGAATAGWPYLLYSVYSPFTPGGQPAPQVSIQKFITGLGVPLANSINRGLLEHPGAFWSGLTGLGLLILAAALVVFLRSKKLLQWSSPAILLLAWGLLNSVQITLSRAVIAPWYATSYVVFWAGLVGFFFTLLYFAGAEAHPSGSHRPGKILLFPAGAAGLLFIAALYFYSNRTYEDKSFYLVSRSPASAACLRAYQTAPTYCESVVFQWGPGNPTYLPEIGSAMQRLGWSVFQPRQVFTLQGDFVLGQVDLASTPGQPGAQWVRGQQDEPAAWSDYHWLNLLMPPNQTIRWQVSLPEQLNSAKLEMGLSIVAPAPCSAGLFSLQIQPSNAAPEPLYRIDTMCDGPSQRKITVDLTAYQGQQVVFSMMNEGPQLRLHYPRVTLERAASSDERLATPPDIRPRNTGFSPQLSPLHGAEAQTPLPLGDNLQYHDIAPSESLLMKAGPEPPISYTFENPFCLENTSEIYFKLALSNAFYKRVVNIRYAYQENPGGEERSGVFIYPLLAGEGLHLYRFPLNLLLVPPGACITRLDWQPPSSVNPDASAWVQLTEAGFIARSQQP